MFARPPLSWPIFPECRSPFSQSNSQRGALFDVAIRHLIGIFGILAWQDLTDLWCSIHFFLERSGWIGWTDFQASHMVRPVLGMSTLDIVSMECQAQDQLDETRCNGPQKRNSVGLRTMLQYNRNNKITTVMIAIEYILVIYIILSISHCNFKIGHRTSHCWELAIFENTFFSSSALNRADCKLPPTESTA